MPPDADTIATQRKLLQEATARLVRTIDGFADEDFAAPSLLPGWTRAHVVAHLALNSEGLGGALTGLVQGEPVPMYASQEARDADIERVSGADPATLRARLMGGSTELDDALAAVPDDAWDTALRRTPDSEVTFRAGAVPGMRLREVEIHHADLGAGYSHRDWSVAFSALLLEWASKRGPADRPFTATPIDLDATFVYGEGGPSVSGTAADLAWWITGRGSGEGLTSDDGDLPRIAEW